MCDKKKIDQYGCPVGCKYCVITKVDSRREMWQQKTIIGMNKAVTIINPPPDKTDINAINDFFDFPIELLRGDIVGFNAISDPFWAKYRLELEYFLEKIAPISKLAVCVTKFVVPDDLLIQLSSISNFRLTVSITGLDSIENTTTKDRVELLRKAKVFGIKAFPIIHPYIAGMSNLSFLPELKKIGYDYIDVKGLRYNHTTMKDWMPSESQKYYINTNEKEILPEDGWREKIELAGMKIKSLKTWYKEDCPRNIILNRAEAESAVAKLLKFANITSSDTDEVVVEEAIKRRL